MFRCRAGAAEVLLVHPGGPFGKKKDQRAWSIPKGEPSMDEELLAAAKREFAEETGWSIESEEFILLVPVRQSGGKLVHAWAVEGDCDPDTIKSNPVEMEWPPGSGTVQRFPEVDRAEWFTIAVAREKILAGQAPLLAELERVLAERQA